MSSSAFDKYPLEYDQWFDNNKAAYQSEIDAIRKFIPAKGEGIEIGVGTGRFSIPFNITIGVDPSEEMAAIARSRGITVHISYAENLSFGTNTFDYALLVTTICFVQNPELALKEIIRILKPNGKIILAIIDKGSELGKKYESLKTSNKFYKSATFYSTKEIIELLHKSKINKIEICQTLFSDPSSMIEKEIVKDGYGEGGFVVLSGTKNKN